MRILDEDRVKEINEPLLAWHRDLEDVLFKRRGSMNHVKGGVEKGPSIHRLLQTRGHVTIDTEEARVVTLQRFTDELFLQRQRMFDCNIE